MSKCFDCANCFYCGRFLSPRHEHDHFPIPRRAGGEATVAVCIDCHDLKDRFPLDAWPASLLAPTLHGSGPQPALELLVAIGYSMPEQYRARFATDGLPVTLRPLTTWSTDEIAEAVLSATTTEARLCLAKALSLSHDWRGRESVRARRDPSAHSDVPQRPRHGFHWYGRGD